MKLAELVPRLQIRSTMKAKSMVPAIQELLGIIANTYTAMNDDEREELADRLEERETLASTVLEFGVAIPHVYHGRFRHLVGAFGRRREGISFGEGQPTVRGIFLLLVPEGRTDLQMLALNKLTEVMQSPGFWRRLMGCGSDDEIFELFEEMDGVVDHG
jgi:mannitol/fructose-specific phosphotransferase system IIA component (Ntr-type)